LAKSSRRAGAKKKASTSRKTSAKKRAPKARKKPARKPSPPTHIELRSIRAFARKHIALIESQAAPHPKALEVRDRMRQWLADVDGSCGPNMTIPLA
jgi:hypothetical protein